MTKAGSRANGGYGGLTVWGVLCILLMTVQGLAQNSDGNAGLYYAAPGEDLMAKIQRHMRIEVSLNKQQVYEGQALEASYHLWVALDVQGKITKAPSYRGFAAYDLSYGNGGDYEVMPGSNVQYKKYLIKRVLLYPLQSGTLRLEPVAMDANVRFLKTNSRREPDYTYPSVTPADTIVAISIQSKPTDVAVLPLPTPAPASFNGAVGRYTIATRLVPDTLAAGATGVLELSIGGQGHLQQLAAPAIAWPAQITAYEPERLDMPDSIYSNLPQAVLWRYPIVAGQAGPCSIPAVTLTFFNPQSRQYEQASSPALSFTITQAVPRQKGSLLPTTGAGTNVLRWLARYGIYILPALALGLVAWIVWRQQRKAGSSPHASRAEYNLPPPTARATQAAQRAILPPQVLQQQMLQWLQAHTQSSVSGPYAPGLHEAQLPWLPALRELWKKCKLAETMETSTEELEAMNKAWQALQKNIGSHNTPGT